MRLPQHPAGNDTYETVSAEATSIGVQLRIRGGREANEQVSEEEIEDEEEETFAR